jgi:triacylglycerol lipase
MATSVLPPMPPLTPGTLDPTTVRWLAQAAELAYATATEVTGQIQGVGLRPTWIDESRTSTQVWIGSDAQRAVVAFRGTDDKLDMRTDAWAAKTTPEWLPGVEVHRGFLVALESVVARIDAEVGERKVWICGHSLGGALATLYALRCAILGRSVAGVVTLGQPRVGTASFAEHYQTRLASRHIRVQNLADPVPRVPPSAWSWAHVGTRWLLDRHGRRTDVPWWRSMLDAIDWSNPFASARSAVHGLIGEHSCSEYLKRLAKA